MRKSLILLAAAVALAVAGVVMYLRSRPLNTAQQVAVAYLQRWQAEDWKGMRVLVDRPPPTFTAAHAQMVNDLSISNLRITPGNLVVTGATAQKPFTVEVALKGLGSWSYNATLHLVRPARRWKVSWTPVTLHPQLASGRKFARVMHWPDRAPILGRDGTVLQGQGDVVSVGVEPDRIKDPGAVIAAFQQYAGIDATTVNRVLHTPGARPSWFLQVTQMRPDQFAALPPAFIQTPGIVVQRTKARTPLRDGFAGHVLGTTGPITAERLAQLGPPYVTGTVVGLSGLEGALERHLAPRIDDEHHHERGSAVEGSRPDRADLLPHRRRGRREALPQHRRRGRHPAQPAAGVCPVLQHRLRAARRNPQGLRADQGGGEPRLQRTRAVAADVEGLELSPAQGPGGPGRGRHRAGRGARHPAAHGVGCRRGGLGGLAPADAHRRGKRHRHGHPTGPRRGSQAPDADGPGRVGPLRHGHPCPAPGHARVGQDRHCGVRHRQPAEDPRLVRRLPRQPRLRRAGGRRRCRREGGSTPGGEVPGPGPLLGGKLRGRRPPW